MLSKPNNYLELLETRAKIVQEYYKVYSDYEILKPYTLDAKEDITLDFINCTICGAKNNLINRKCGKNYVLLQPCLRNNHINLLKDPNCSSNYMSYFTMLGGFSYISDKNWIEEFNKIVFRQFNFFRKLYPDNLIKLTIPIEYANFLPLTIKTKKYLLSNNCLIEISDKDKENLKWKYGIKDIKGYGTRWEILTKENKLINCGNDIILFDKDKPIGIDFGSGLETLVAVINDNENLLYSNMICTDEIKSFCLNNINKEKLIDSITSIICIIEYKEYKSFQVKNLIRMYIKIISAIMIIENITNEALVELIKNISQTLKINYENFIHEIIIDIINRQEDLKELTKSDIGKEIMDIYKSGIEPRYYIKGYFQNIYDIELKAMEKIIEKENKYVKTREIK